MDHNFKFKDFKWLARMDGFGYPIDVSYGTIYLGLIVAEPDGFVIELIDTPHGKKPVKKGGRNKFKSQNQAAEALHYAWKKLRQGTAEVN